MVDDWQDYRPTLTMRCVQCGDTFTTDETHGCLSVGQMIEELCADGDTLCVGIHEEGWAAWLRDRLYIGGGDTPREAIAELARSMEGATDGKP